MRDREGRAPSLRVLVAAALIAAVAGIAGCGATGSVEDSGLRSSTPSVGAPEIGTQDKGYSGTANGGGDEALQVAPEGIDRKIVVNKTLRMETKDVDAAVEKIRALTSREKGEIASLQISSDDGEPIYLESGEQRPTGNGTLIAFITVRVPADRYDAFVKDAAELGRVLSQSETADDVTQQHLDMTARLESLKIEQSRLRQLFSRADKVSDMLAIEKELTRVQGEIESMRAQLDYLNRQVAMATVNIELREPDPIGSPSGDDWGVRGALAAAIRAFVDTVNALIFLLGPALALGIFVGLPVWLIIRTIVRRSRRHRVASPPTDAVDGSTQE